MDNPASMHLSGSSQHRQPASDQLRRCFQTAIDVICMIDANGYFRQVNHAALRVWGFRPEELTGRRVLDFCVDADKARFAARLRDSIAGTPVPDFRMRAVHKNGQNLPLSWSIQHDAVSGLIFCIARVLNEPMSVPMDDILDRIKDGYFLMDREWRITFANGFVEDMLHIRREDYLGRNYFECFPTAIGTEYEQQYKKAMRDNTPVHFEAWFPPFEKWLSVDAFPSESGLSVFFRDVTEKRRSREERMIYKAQIEAQNALLGSILNNMNQVFFLLDAEMRVIYWNSLASRLFGVSRQEVMGRRLREWLDAESLEVYEPLVEEVLLDQRHIRAESICPRTKRWEEVDMFPTDGGISVFIRDVHERKRTEEELRKLSLVAENTVNIVIISDAQGAVLWANRAAVEASGYSFDELIGRPIGEVVDGPETKPESVAFVQERRAAFQPYELEAINYRRDGTPYWVHVLSQPLFDEQGGLQYYFSIATDITERKRLEQSLQRQQKRTNAAVIAAQEKERAQVGRELHDNVNQVLTSVKLYQELLLSGIGDEEVLVRKSIDLLQSSINEIRSLSKRLSAPTLGNIRLRESVRELADTVAATRQFAISVDTDAVQNLEVDETLHLALYRILQEQLTNILKYADASLVQLSFQLEHEILTMIVSDNGRGFDPQQKSRGIGLSNIKARAESLGGVVKVESAPGQGFRLTVSIPLDGHVDADLHGY